MYVGVLGINTDCLARSVMDCHGFGSAHCVVGWSCCVHLQGTRVTVCLCPNAECCLFPWLLLCMAAGGAQQMWKGESISHSFYVRSYQEKNMCLFSFPCIAKIFVIPSLLEGFFASHYTVCVQLLSFVGTLLSPLCSAHRSWKQRFDSFLPCSISSMPWCACPPTGWCLQRSSVRCDVLWELWLSPMSLISRCHCSPGLCFHPHSHPRQPSKPPGE